MQRQSDHDKEIMEAFWRRIFEEWLPTYCNDPERRYSTEGFKPDAKLVSVQDAHDFIRALDYKIVTDVGGGRYRMPRSGATEYLFWEGKRDLVPRPITLWLEPFITMAAMARLHMDFGWPIECLGMQSKKNWEFDIVVFRQQDFNNEYIAGEVKPDSNKLDSFLTNLNKCCAQGVHDCSSAPKDRLNAHKKWQGLRRSHAPLFWSLGPSGDSRVFEVSYSSDGIITLNKTTNDRLHFSYNNRIEGDQDLCMRNLEG